MKRPVLNKYYVNAVVLMAAAVAFLGIAVLTNRGDLSTAALIIAGFASFLLGIFFLTYSGGELVDPAFVSLLPVQDSINLCRVMGDLGISGAACVLPGSGDADELSQFNPAGTFHLPPPGDNTSFRLTPPVGMYTGPSALPLYRQLFTRYAWSRPREPLQVAQGLKEVAEEVYRLADTVEVDLVRDLCTVTLREFRYIEGCMAVQRGASPACCRMYPCPICSLMMCIITGGLGSPTTIDRIDPDEKARTLTVMIRMLGPEEQGPAP